MPVGLLLGLNLQLSRPVDPPHLYEPRLLVFLPFFSCPLLAAMDDNTFGPGGYVAQLFA